MQVDKQIWKCTKTGLLRAWGIGEAFDPKATPMLESAGGVGLTQHEYVGVKSAPWLEFLQGELPVAG